MHKLDFSILALVRKKTIPNYKRCSFILSLSLSLYIVKISRFLIHQHSLCFHLPFILHLTPPSNVATSKISPPSPVESSAKPARKSKQIAEGEAYLSGLRSH